MDIQTLNEVNYQTLNEVINYQKYRLDFITDIDVEEFTFSIEKEKQILKILSQMKFIALKTKLYNDISKLRSDSVISPEHVKNPH